MDVEDLDVRRRRSRTSGAVAFDHLHPPPPRGRRVFVGEDGTELRLRDGERLRAASPP